MPTLSVRLILFCCGSLLFGSIAVGEGTYQHTRDDKTTVWNSNPKPGESASWNGRRDKDGYAKGFGTLTWYKDEYTVYARYFGNMVRGKLNGAVNVHSQGKTAHAFFADGKRVSRWTMGSAPAHSVIAKQSQTEGQAVAKIEKKTPPKEGLAVAEARHQTPSPPKEGSAVAEARRQTPSPPKEGLAVAEARHQTPNPPKEKSAAPDAQRPITDVPAEGPVVAKTEIESIDAGRMDSVEIHATSNPPKATPNAESANHSPANKPNVEPPAKQVPEVKPEPVKSAPTPAADNKPPVGVDDSLRSLVRPPAGLRVTSYGDFSPDGSQQEASAPNSTARPTKEEAIAAADSAIRIAGYNLSAYHRSRAEYNAAADTWFLIYDRKPAKGVAASAEELSVAVDGTTKQTTIVPGK